MWLAAGQRWSGPRRGASNPLGGLQGGWGCDQWTIEFDLVCRGVENFTRGREEPFREKGTGKQGPEARRGCRAIDLGKSGEATETLGGPALVGGAAFGPQRSFLRVSS